jgi:hypothetical protein
MSDMEYPLPPATFEVLTTSLKMQAEIQMGLLHFGDEADRPKPDLRLARHSIDMLAMLEEKTRGNLSMEEKRLIENSLTELRFRYIQAIEADRKNSQIVEATAEQASS